MQIIEKDIIDDEIFHVSLSGKIYTRTDFDTLTELIDEQIGKGIHKFSLNLTGITFVSSGGLGTLVQLEKHVRKDEGKLCLYGMTGEVKELFSITLLDRKINIVANKEASLEFLGK